MPISQPPSSTIAGWNQPIRCGAAANLGVDEAEQRTAGDGLCVGVVDEVPAAAEACGAQALGAGGHGQDYRPEGLLHGGEEEGGENRGLAPLRLALLGERAVVPEDGRGHGLRPGGAVSFPWRRRRGRGEHGGWAAQQSGRCAGRRRVVEGRGRGQEHISGQIIVDYKPIRG
jgi:hypothetical protein